MPGRRSASCSGSSSSGWTTAIDWLRSLGAEEVWSETGNPRTVGVRFDPRQLTETLVRAAGDVRFAEPRRAGDDPLLLATGGFQGDRELVREHIAPGGELFVRSNRWSSGDGLRLGLERGAALSAGMDEFYGRAMPAPPPVCPRIGSSSSRSSTAGIALRPRR